MFIILYSYFCEHYFKFYFMCLDWSNLSKVTDWSDLSKMTEGTNSAAEDEKDVPKGMWQ